MGYVCASIIGFWAVIEGFKYVEASIGGLLGLLEVVFSIIFGIVIFHQGLTFRSGTGALLVILAASLPHIATLRRKYLPSMLK